LKKYYLFLKNFFFLKKYNATVFSGWHLKGTVPKDISAKPLSRYFFEGA
jgi:hypothetical protein